MSVSHPWLGRTGNHAGLIAYHSRHGRLWLIFGLTVSAAFFILGFFGREVYRQAPLP